MNLNEALIALGQGKKVRRTIWAESSNYLFSEEGRLVFFDGTIKQALGYKQILVDFSLVSQWELWKDPNQITFGELGVGEEFIWTKERYMKIRMCHTNTCGFVQLTGGGKGQTGEFSSGGEVIKCPVSQ